jgi:hypothetical protein
MADTEADYSRFHPSSVFIGRFVCRSTAEGKTQQLVDCGSQLSRKLEYSLVQESINAINLEKLRQLFHDVSCLIS